MRIAVVGLGKMGAQIAKRLVESGHEVVAVDPAPAAVKAAAEFGAEPALSRADAIAKFAGQRAVVWLMIPAAYVSGEVAAWLEVMPAGGLLIDGGNTNFQDTQEHAKLAASKGVSFTDVGVSGGILGTANGFSMMVGGEAEAYKQIQPVLQALSSPRGGYEYFGQSGSGHFVKMVHNAIEYGMMESLAEGYRVLKEGPMPQLDLAKAGAVWQKASVIEGTLNELAAQIMSEDQDLGRASGYVAESGEARWTLEAARRANIELPAIAAAMDVRLRSAKGDTNYATKLLAELRNKFGGHSINKQVLRDE